MSNIPTNTAFKKIISNNIAEDFYQFIRGSDLTVLGWIDANGILQGSLVTGIAAAGSDKQVQVNRGGVLAGDANFAWDSAQKQLTVVQPTGLDPTIFGGITTQQTAIQATAIRIGETGPQYAIEAFLQASDSGVVSGVYSTALATGINGSNAFAFEGDSFSKPNSGQTFDFNSAYIAFASNDGPGTVTDMAGYFGQVGSTAGVTTNSSAFTALAPYTIIGKGTVHNNFGFAAKSQAGYGDTINAGFYAYDQGSGANDYAYYAAGGKSLFAGNLSIASLTPATGFNNPTSSPILKLNGTYWNGSSSQTDSWTLQNILAANADNSADGSTLTLTHSGALGALQITATTNITGNFTLGGNFLTTGSITFYGQGQSGSGSSVLTAAANAVAGNTTYTGTIPGTNTIIVGTYVTVTGFTNSANNGTFYVVSFTSTTLVLANPSGVAETHAGTATCHVAYSNDLGTISALGGGSGSISLLGTTSAAHFAALSAQGTFGLVLEKAGDPFDAAIFDIFASANGDHGFALYSICDGTGTNPFTFKMGKISSNPTLKLLLPDGLSGVTGVGTGFTAGASVGTLVLAASVGDGSTKKSITVDGSAGVSINCGEPVITNQTVGVGNGAGTNITAPAKSTGSGPASLVAATWEQVSINGSTYWRPLFQ